MSSKMVRGTKALGGEIQQWQGPGTPGINHVGSYFAGGHEVVLEQARLALSELHVLYGRRKAMEMSDHDADQLGRTIRALLRRVGHVEPRGNPSRKTGPVSNRNIPEAMLGVLDPRTPTKKAIAEARKIIPTSEIDHVVGNYHVSEDPSVVGDRIRALGVRAKWPAAAVEAAVEYAKKRHAANLRMYSDVMGGRIGRGKR